MNAAVFSLSSAPPRPGGGFPLFGAAYAEALVAQEPQLRIETAQYQGQHENVPLLQAGKLDSGWSPENSPARHSPQPGTQLRIVRRCNPRRACSW